MLGQVVICILLLNAATNAEGSEGHVKKVIIKTANEDAANSDDPPLIKICSKSDDSQCCSFTPPNLAKNNKIELSNEDLENCNNFKVAGGISQVEVTGQGTDGWKGEYIHIVQGSDDTFEAYTMCPIRQWIDIDESNPQWKEMTLSCEKGYEGLLKYFFIKLSNFAGTDQPPQIEICSNANSTYCCSFTSPKIPKNNQIAFFGAIGNCKKFKPQGGIGKITVSSQGNDDMEIEYVSFAQFPFKKRGYAVTFCPITQVINTGTPQITPKCYTSLPMEKWSLHEIEIESEPKDNSKFKDGSPISMKICQSSPEQRCCDTGNILKEGEEFDARPEPPLRGGVMVNTSPQGHPIQKIHLNRLEPYTECAYFNMESVESVEVPDSGSDYWSDKKIRLRLHYKWDSARWYTCEIDANKGTSDTIKYVCQKGHEKWDFYE